jgi:hypothetical protein
MLSCDFLGHRILVLVGQFVAEYSLLHLRSPGKPLGFREQALLADVLTKCTRRTFEAWERFESAAEQDGSDDEVRRNVDAGREALADELGKAIAVFKELPGSVV